MIVITATATEIRITSPYEARDLIKEIPGRKWDPTRKIWTAPSWALAEAKSILAAWPGGVRILTDHPTTTKTNNWADAMFDALPERLHERAYKALARVLHPDVDGDPEQMKVLTGVRTSRTK
ncbi:hypothetical protein AADG42_10125 [Ammonicoccus fulvus]|uniref:DUF5710 domain-containing protein n=1 Tax=Ammonicoccus fulvus TaxID=3138240 RepID=A0ABZ3FS39_9ACTN